MQEKEIIQQLSTLTHQELVEGLDRTKAHLETLKERLQTDTDLVSLYPPLEEKDKSDICKLLSARNPRPSLYFISKDVAQALANSSHAYLKEKGESCLEYLNSTTENKYVHPSGVYIACIRLFNNKTGGWDYNFDAYWDIKTNTWGNFYNHIRAPWSSRFESQGGAAPIKELHANASPSQCRLLCDIHIAAAIGDVGTIHKHVSADSNAARNSLNSWGNTPLDCAVATGQHDAIQLLLRNKAELKESHLLTAIEKGDFKLIDLLLSAYKQVSDAMIKQAEKRNAMLAEYLSMYQYSAIGKTIESLHTTEPLSKLKEILLDEHVNRQAVSNFLQLRPNALSILDANNPNTDCKKDTILHWAAKQKDPQIFIALVEGIYHCKFQGVDISSFVDIQAANAKSQTALDILMANKDIQFNAAIKALILFCNPMLPIKLCEKIALERKMDFLGIDQERKALDQQQIVATAIQLRENTRALIKMSQHNIALTNQVATQERQIASLSAQVQEQNQALITMGNMLTQLCDTMQTLGININNPQRAPLQALARANLLTFVPAPPAQENRNETTAQPTDRP